MDKLKAARQKRVSSKNEGSGSLILGLFIVAGMLLASVFLIYNSYRSLVDTIYRLELLDEAESEVQALRLKNLELLLQSEKVKTDYFVELQARDRLNLSAEGEYVVIIPEELMQSTALENLYKEYQKPKSVEVLPTGIEAWVYFLEKGL